MLARSWLPLLVALALASGCYGDHARLAPPLECEQPGEVPPLETLDGVPVFWSGDACLRVTYDPALEAWRDAIADATAVWEIDCSPICFDAPAPATIDPASPPAGSVHFHPMEGEPTGSGLEAFAATTSTYRRSTGEMIAGTVAMSADGPPSAALLVHHVGHVIGLGHPTFGTPSVMDADPATGITEPTCVDLRSLCLRYED